MTKHMIKFLFWVRAWFELEGNLCCMGTFPLSHELDKADNDHGPWSGLCFIGFPGRGDLRQHAQPTWDISYCISVGICGCLSLTVKMKMTLMLFTVPKEQEAVLWVCLPF